MTTYPPRLTLPYRVANAWLEERTLAGEIVEPVQWLTIDCDTLDSAGRAHAARVAKHIDTQSLEAHDGPIVVLGSGLDPSIERLGPGGTPIRQTDLAVRRLGQLPELAQPAEDPVELLAAYDRWIARYLEFSEFALTEWIKRWSTDTPSDGEVIWWHFAVPFSIDDAPMIAVVDGRRDPQLFHRAVGAAQLCEATRAVVDQEDWDVASQIVGPLVPGSRQPDELVHVYGRRIARLSDLALARYWTRLRAKDGFDVEMRRWALERGTERLQIGLSDGYRMVSVYLDERLAKEAPGFYAHLPKRDDPHTWQPRTGPSEEALLIRRAVETRLQLHTPPGMPVPQAEIGWMKSPPLAICDRSHCFATDEWGNLTDELREWPFEVIGVRGWLGRYTLIAGVYKEDGDRPPPFLLLRYMLRPEQYGVSGIDSPPIGVSLDDLEVVRRRDDDIPF